MGMIAGIPHIKLPGPKQRTILDESDGNITHGCRQPSHRQWHEPNSLYAPYRSYLFESQVIQRQVCHRSSQTAVLRLQTLRHLAWSVLRHPYSVRHR